MAGLQSELLFELHVDVEEAHDLGATPHGTRLIHYVKGGSFAGPKLRGEVLPGGGDWFLIRPDGARELNIRETLRTDDGHLIYISMRGIVLFSPELLQRIRRGEAVDPSEYYFRTTPVFETGSEKYGWLNRIVAVGVGTRLPTGVVHTIYAIL